MAKIFNAQSQVGQKEKNSFKGFPYIIIISFSLLPPKKWKINLGGLSFILYHQKANFYIFKNYPIISY